MSHDFLALSRLRFFAHHGIFPDEIERGQYFEVSVKLELSLDCPGRTDELAFTVDYRDVHEAVRLVLEGPSRKLVEFLAESVAAALLEKFRTVEAVEVDVLKPNPPVNFDFAGFTPHVRRERVKSPQT